MHFLFNIQSYGPTLGSIRVKTCSPKFGVHCFLEIIRSSRQKNERTLQKRAHHFVQFLTKNYISLDIWNNITDEDKDIIYGCYAQYLAQGNTLMSMAIKTDTIRAYLKAAGANTTQTIKSKKPVNKYAPII